jgi:hypothetical protein
LRKLVLLIAAAVTAVWVVGTASSAPSVPAVDRGLPTANLNDAAGSDRSNVAWAQVNDSGDQTYVTGDTFSIGSTGQQWVVTGIRTWNIGHLGTPFSSEFSDVTLYFGTGAIAPVTGATFTPTAVTYSDGSNYQAGGGAYRQIWQDDFTNLDLAVNGGETYYFAVDGTSSDYYWFNHASNAALSGSPQQGADGTYYTWAKSDLSTPMACDSAGSGGCNGGWDKSSDINVQVFASQLATSKNACKKYGWTNLVRADGSAFKNQGDCIQYVNTGK